MSAATANIPIVVCTAATDEVRQQEGWLVSQGIKIVLKPFGIDDLELAVTKALQLPDLVVGLDGDQASPGTAHATREA